MIATQTLTAPATTDPRPPLPNSRMSPTIARGALVDAEDRRLMSQAMQPGRLWLAEIAAGAAALPPMECDACISASLVIHDPGLAPLVARALPPGRYRETARAREAVLDDAELERCLRLARDGWSVLRLIEGDLLAAARTDCLRRVTQALHRSGMSGAAPMRLLTNARGGAFRQWEIILDDDEPAAGTPSPGLGVNLLIVAASGADGPVWSNAGANGLAG